MYLHELYQRERHADFVIEAKHDQVVRAAKEATHKPFYKPALAAVGAKLVQVGNRLQDNVETVAPAPMLSAGKRVHVQ